MSQFGAGPVDDVIIMAREVMASPAHRPIVERAVKRIGPMSAQGLEALRFHLAYAYAQGYLLGWNRARRERADLIPPPGDPVS
jgi:hypothetical protein